MMMVVLCAHVFLRAHTYLACRRALLPGNLCCCVCCCCCSRAKPAASLPLVLARPADRDEEARGASSRLPLLAAPPIAEPAALARAADDGCAPSMLLLLLLLLIAAVAAVAVGVCATLF